MGSRFVILGFLLFSVTSICAQPPGPPSDELRRRAREREAARQTDISFRRLHDLEIPRVRNAVTGKWVDDEIRAIYRKPDKKDIEILSPSKNLLDDYASFLRQSNTGIFKLNADDRCAQNTEIVVAIQDCIAYKMPGAGTAYSFRFDSYRIPRLADLTLRKNTLKTDGALQQGIMVNLGDVPLEDITVQSDGLRYLADFKPAAGTNEMRRILGELRKGIQSDGFVYGLGFYASDKTTYALRSIAYKAEFPRALNGVAYDEFSFDKRKDVLVVFRVIEKESNGNITILWKRLRQQNAPTLIIERPGSPPTE